MLKIRLQRYGKSGAPYYRIAVLPKTSRRDGKPVELLGSYNPRTKELVLNVARAAYWQSVGAIPSDTVAALLKRTPDHNLENGPFNSKVKTRSEKLKHLAELKSKSTKIGKAERQRREAKKQADEEAAKKAAEEAAAAKEAAEAPAEAAPAA